MLPETVGGTAWWRRYWVVPAAVLVAVLVLFVVVEAAGPPVLTDPSPWLRAPGLLSAAVGVALLVVDAALPVPSSLVMVAHGALFGVAAGTMLSTVGSLGAFAVGFAAGRRGSSWLRRFLPAGELARADAALARWGLLAIVVTRPVPLLAETVAVMAGASALPWRRALGAALAGCLPLAAVYAVAGAFTTTFEHSAVAFVLVVAAAGALWLTGRRHTRTG